MDDQISLADAPREINSLGARVTYQQLYRAVLDGRVPAERGTGNRWRIRKADLPKIARSFGADGDSVAAA